MPISQFVWRNSWYSFIFLFSFLVSRQCTVKQTFLLTHKPTHTHTNGLSYNVHFFSNTNTLVNTTVHFFGSPFLRRVQGEKCFFFFVVSVIIYISLLHFISLYLISLPSCLIARFVIRPHYLLHNVFVSIILFSLQFCCFFSPVQPIFLLHSVLRLG